MTLTIGIRREDNPHERRTALCPTHIRKLIQENVTVLVQPSQSRIFSDAEYLAAGAHLSETLREASIIVGVKEIEPESIEHRKTYLCFSHTIKGQPSGHALLRALCDRQSTLLDYERITNENNERLVYFGNFAGFAGMLDTLWALGQRWAERDRRHTPLLELRRSHHYSDLDEAKAALIEVGKRLAHALPEQACPLTIAIVGTGNTSQGAQTALQALNAMQVEPSQLHVPKTSSKPVRYALFRSEDWLVRDEGSFDARTVREQPELYRSTFEPFLKQIHLLMNCIYWNPRSPRLISVDALTSLYQQNDPCLELIGDISCDIEGAIAITQKTFSYHATLPVYTYDIEQRCIQAGYRGKGPSVFAVSNLPASFPLEASNSFGDALLPLLLELIRHDLTVEFSQLSLPSTLKRALVVHRGALTPDYHVLTIAP